MLGTFDTNGDLLLRVETTDVVYQHAATSFAAVAKARLGGKTIADLLEEGFTGEITDKAGVKRRYVNGVQVKWREDEPEGEAKPAEVEAEIGNQRVKAIASDPQHGLVKIRAEDGTEKVVRKEELNFKPGQAEPPQEEETPHGGFQMYSPNKEEGMQYENALKNLQSEQQKKFQEMSNNILEQLGLKDHKAENAVGDWKDGAENSVLQTIEGNVDKAAQQYAAALLGDMADQKAVLTFQYDPEGKDAMYEMDIPKDVADVRKTLAEKGIAFRTLVPHENGTKVVVFDQGDRLLNKIISVGDHYDVAIRQTRGEGQFIGGDDRDRAHSAYRKVIDEWEKDPHHPKFDPQKLHPDGGGKERDDGKHLKGSGTRDDPYRCGSNIKLAANLLAEGHHIRLKQPEQVSTLIGRMGRMIEKAVEKGEQAPNFNLCQISVKGTNLFCQENLGVPRIRMPQMRGLPVPGTFAATKKPAKSGKVDLSQDFIEHLKKQGIKTEKTKIPASHLRASQAEIVGARVAQLVNEAKAGDRDLREKPIFVTRDNYVVDGHHHWAAIVGEGAGKGKDLKVPVYKLDMDIGQALDEANDFTKKMGLAPKSGTSTPPAKADFQAPITKEKTTPPPPDTKTAHVYDPDPTKDAEHSRVGVPAHAVPPPPPIGRLPRLTKNERLVEARFADQFEAEPEKMVADYHAKKNNIVGAVVKVKNHANAGTAAEQAGFQVQVKNGKDGTPSEYVITGKDGKALTEFLGKHAPMHSLQYEVGDAPNIFATDDAKMLSDVYNPPRDSGISREDTMANRSRYNTVLHQTANAVAKRAFLEYLDQLPADKKTVLVTSGGVACHGRDTPILMFDGSIRMVQDVKEGELVMGPDSKPRTVLKFHHGTGQLYRVTPRRGDSFVANGEHVLSLREISRNGHNKEKQKWHTINVTVNEVLARGKRFRKNSYLYRTGVEFKSAPVPLDPYYLGVWLGDGTHCVPSITTADNEVVEYLHDFVNKYPSLKLIVHPKPNNRASVYQMSLREDVPYPTGTFCIHRKNPITEALRGLDVLRNKHIPQCYLANDRKVRLQLLAGLLDADGFLDTNGVFDLVTKFAAMSEQIAFLVRSLGFCATVRKCFKTNTTTGRMGTYYRITIGGDTLNEIPTKVLRKRAEARPSLRSNGKKTRTCLHTGYSIEPIGVGEFFGFTLDQDHLYLLGDFTVTHNSGKGYAIGNVSAVNKVATMAGAVWDAAGEQNATENDWVLQECEKRGIKPTFVFVHSNPNETWENPDRGVVERAGKTGRMVDARLFADSYVLGAKNFHEFHEKNKEKAQFFVLDNTGKEPKVLDRVPDAALHLDADELYDRCVGYLQNAKTVNPAVKRGGTNGLRIWPHGAKEKKEAKAAQESREPSHTPATNLLEEGFTGQITDSIGREVHFVDGKRVKWADGEERPTISAPTVQGSPVKVLHYDPENQLVRVEDATGTRVVPKADLDLGASVTPSASEKAHVETIADRTGLAPETVWHRALRAAGRVGLTTAKILASLVSPVAIEHSDDSVLPRIWDAFWNQGREWGPEARGEGMPVGGVVVKESKEANALESGFTGVITDTIGRKVHFVDGKRVKWGYREKPADNASGRSIQKVTGQPHPKTPKLGGQPVTLLGYDKPNQRVQVKLPSGEEVVVGVHEINFQDEPEKTDEPEHQDHQAPASWDAVDPDVQDQVRERWVETHFDDFYDAERNHWAESLPESIRENLAQDTDWHNNYFVDWAVEQGFTRRSAEAALEPEYHALTYDQVRWRTASDVPEDLRKACLDFANSQDETVRVNAWHFDEAIEALKRGLFPAVAEGYDRDKLVPDVCYCLGDIGEAQGRTKTAHKKTYSSEIDPDFSKLKTDPALGETEPRDLDDLQSEWQSDYEKAQDKEADRRYEWELQEPPEDLDDSAREIAREQFGELSDDEKLQFMDDEGFDMPSPVGDDNDEDNSRIDKPEDKPPEVPKKKIKAPKSEADVVDRATDTGAELSSIFPHIPEDQRLKEIASVVGAPDDAEVDVISAGKYRKRFSDDVSLDAHGIRVKVQHDKLEDCTWFIGVDSSGRRFARLELIIVRPQYRKEGLGASIVYSAVDNAAADGMDYISLHAAGKRGHGFNGYYTWPVMGWDESVSKLARSNPSLYRKIRRDYPEVSRVREIMATEDGRKWWKENGADLHDARFDLHEGSWSQYILTQYQERKMKEREANEKKAV